IICYHCQQAVEKFLKAYIIYRGEEIAKIHNLLALNNNCKKYDETFEEIDEKCSKLNSYGVIVRYPFHTIDIEEIDVNQAILYAETIKKFIEDKFIEDEKRI
ncbi:MAG: HEPN domain-containing protein, partial [Nitrososphaerota archaeon]|nr:HEPN domain-containing protein [Nitrososphaerota archaeon]